MCMVFRGVCVCYCRTYDKAVRGGGRRRVEDMCYEDLRILGGSLKSRGNVVIHRGHKPIQGDDTDHVGCHGKVSQALPYPEPLRVTGPLPSLVLRAEDMWRKHNQ